MLAASLLLMVVASTAIALDSLAHNERLASWLAHESEEYCRKTKTTFWNDGYFADIEDRLLNEELPAADYSKGGVYLMGASNLRAATKFWELPPEQRALIHNYAISRSSHSDVFQFLHYLVDQRGMLRAGGGKTMIILGVSYGEIQYQNDPEEYFAKLWERHGLYHCSAEKGITPVPVNPLWHFVHFERVRIAGCLDKLSGSVIHQIRSYRGIKPQNKHGEDFYELRPHLYSEQTWNKSLHDQMEDFDRMLGFLNACNVHVAVVILPYGSWEDKWTFKNAYTAEITAVCNSNQIPLYDWSGRLEDDDFQDSSHLNVIGAEKLQPAFLEIALPFLRSTRALP